MRKKAVRQMLCIGSILGVFLLLTVFSLARAGSVTTTKDIVVRPGDTLWQIATQYGSSSKDVRETVYSIRNLNGLQGSTIVPGQVLKIPAK